MVRKDELARPWWLLPPGRLHPAWWGVVAAALIWNDYVGGPGSSQFPVLYVIPVTLTAWYSGRWPAVGMAVAVPLAHIAFLLIASPWPWQFDALAVPISATIFRSAVIVVMAFWFARLAEHERALYRHVQRLEGLLPICSFCKSIRNKAGEWESLETFISTRSEAEFSHGFCADCGKTHYPEAYPSEKRASS